MLVIYFIANSTYAQVYDFQTFTVENGLSQSQVLSLYQTNTGELWLGTNQGGVNIYDGSEFRYLTRENGLSDNVVYAINQIGNDVLIGTNNGLTVISGLDTTIYTTEQGLPHNGVVSILVSRKNEVWLGTGAGIAKWQNDSVFPVTIDSALANSTVLNIREGSDGGIWFCTVQSGLFKYDGETTKQTSTEDGLARNYVFDVLPLGEKYAWIFGYGGFYHLKGDLIERMKGLPAGFPENGIYYSFTRDKAKNIWIGSSSGVLKYADGRFSAITTKNGLVNNNIWKILHDREGNIWFGSKSNGVSKLTSERFRLYNSTQDLPDEDVTAVIRQNDSTIWFGTRKGLAIWNGENRAFIDQDNGLNSLDVRDLAKDASGKIYVATNYGFSIYEDGKFRAFEMAENNLNDCHDVFADGNEIWFGTKVGPAKLVGERLVQPGNAAEFSSYVFDMVRKDNAIWMAYDDGVLKYDGTSFVNLKKEDGFFDGRSRSVVVGPNGKLWFGTNEGVFVFDGDSCSRIGIENGLVSDAVYSLQFDPSGDLWVGQSKGLARIVFQNDSITDVLRYGRPQGFLGIECHTNSTMADADGTLWVGTGNGLVVYDPSKDKGLYYKAKTRITGVKLFSQDIDWSEFSDSVSITGLPLNAELPYHRNHLTFEFSGVSLTSPLSINYSYKLEGLDEDWSAVTNVNQAVYTNIPPGDYTFKVKAGFGDELRTNDPVSISFSVKAPFYRTNLFYALCLMILTGIAYSYYTIRKANKKITKQNQQIEQQKTVIETKNQNMVDSINYASRIQSATLPSDEEWFRNLPNSFILFKPKDIVSGDFYWMTKVGDDIFFAVVDCTGHGVPGALMSIIGYHGLNRAVNEMGFTKPSLILKTLSKSVNESLRKSEYDNYVKDGMDVSLCKVNLTTNTLQFAGSVNPCLIVRNNQEILLKGDRVSIGSMEMDKIEFTNHLMKLEPGDSVYIYSDGYADQFGGEEGKKLKTPVMRRKLVEVSALDITKQKSALTGYLSEWQGDHPQVDDICVIGLKI